MIVRGFIYHVRAEEDGQTLATYETNGYRIESCRIIYTDGKERTDAFGRTFNFAVWVHDLEEGDSDSTAWLRRIGRENAADQVITEEVSASCTE
jgi:hypothetical protein